MTHFLNLSFFDNKSDVILDILRFIYECCPSIRQNVEIFVVIGDILLVVKFMELRDKSIIFAQNSLKLTLKFWYIPL